LAGLQITSDDNGRLVFLDGEGRRLDRLVNLEMAGWLDWWHGWWHGWRGGEYDPHQLQAVSEKWAVFT
jgi:hypothetical protein